MSLFLRGVVWSAVYPLGSALALGSALPPLCSGCGIPAMGGITSPHLPVRPLTGGEGPAKREQGAPARWKGYTPATIGATCLLCETPPAFASSCLLATAVCLGLPVHGSRFRFSTPRPRARTAPIRSGRRMLGGMGPLILPPAPSTLRVSLVSKLCLN